MDITITGRKLTVTPALRDYAEEKIGTVSKAMDIEPLTVEVVLNAERNPSNPTPCVCEVTLQTKGHIIRVEERDADMYAAIDVAAAKVTRQMRKYKTKVLGRREVGRVATPTAAETDFDKLMAELSAEDEALVRVKDVDFKPITQEEALIQIDLLGHDFYGYIDRDTDKFCIVYRRSNGGYGLLQQAD